MNWDNIRFNTPEAFKKLLEFNKQFKYEHGSWYDINNIGMDYYIERDLFSFFDERGSPLTRLILLHQHHFLSLNKNA